MHTVVFDGEVRHILQLSVRCPKKLFESHPRLLDFRHAIPLTNRQPELACPVDYHLGNVDCLYLCSVHPYDVRKLKDFLDCGEYGRDQVARVVICLLEDILPFQKLVQHQLTVVVLKVCKYTLHGVVDRFVFLFQLFAKYDSLTVPTICCTSACSTPVTSQNRRTSLVCMIRMLEFAWVVVPSVMMRGPG